MFGVTVHIFNIMLLLTFSLSAMRSFCSDSCGSSSSVVPFATRAYSSRTIFRTLFTLKSRTKQELISVTKQSLFRLISLIKAMQGLNDNYSSEMKQVLIIYILLARLHIFQ